MRRPVVRLAVFLDPVIPMSPAHSPAVFMLKRDIPSWHVLPTEAAKAQLPVVHRSGTPFVLPRLADLPTRWIGPHIAVFDDHRLIPNSNRIASLLGHFTKVFAPTSRIRLALTSKRFMSTRTE